ncbi:MAG: MATE family efflux transporter [Paramuribaculum sp.]|nr:MATE family efflux transporter [Paramuribaculum sp.]
MSAEGLLCAIRDGRQLNFREQFRLTVLLSFPAIIAQLSTIAMQYIDASMVGSLGANASASIGLITTTTWLFWGVCSAAVTGFSVQVAHLIGASDFEKARDILRQSITAMVLFSIGLSLLGVIIANPLPHWLGGDESICQSATNYFLIFSLFLPVLQVSFLAGSMLRCSGNMKVPSILNVLMCIIDVILNFFLIFPSRNVSVLGISLYMPGAGLGVEGAALGTVLAELIVAILMIYYLCWKSDLLRIVGNPGSYRIKMPVLKNAVKIGLPMGLEHIAISGAQIALTIIVAPLGIIAIAANAFAIIAESLCYMPGYGIGEASTTLAGQCRGAGRIHLMRRFGNITVISGMLIMGLMGLVLYVAAPQIIGIMSPVEDIRLLGVDILRIEAFAEPMFGASIVAYGFFVGIGRTILPSTINIVCIWGIRITLAAVLAPIMGLKGVWLAMCIELCMRGLLFLILLWGVPSMYRFKN